MNDERRAALHAVSRARSMMTPRLLRGVNASSSYHTSRRSGCSRTTWRLPRVHQSFRDFPSARCIAGRGDRRGRRHGVDRDRLPAALGPAKASSRTARHHALANRDYLQARWRAVLAARRRSLQLGFRRARSSARQADRQGVCVQVESHVARRRYCSRVPRERHAWRHYRRLQRREAGHARLPSERQTSSTNSRSSPSARLSR